MIALPILNLLLLSYIFPDSSVNVNFISFPPVADTVKTSLEFSEASKSFVILNFISLLLLLT